MAKKPTVLDATAEVAVSIIDNLNHDGIPYGEGDVIILTLSVARQLKALGVVDFDEADLKAADPVP